MNLFNSWTNGTFTGRVSRDDYQSNYLGGLGSSTGYSTNYNAGLFLTQPAYPVLNIQYSRQYSGSNYSASSSKYDMKTWILGSYYDLAPLRFTFDSTRQDYGYAGVSNSGTTNTQRSAILLNEAILSGLTVAGELSRYSVNTKTGGFSSSISSLRRLVRFSAIPTPAVVADFEYAKQSSDQSFGTGTVNTDDETITMDARSQLFPGFTADYTDQRQKTSNSILAGASTSRNRALGLSAILSDDAVANATISRSKFDSFGQPSTTQDSAQVGAQLKLTPDTDLTLDFADNKTSVLGSSSFGGRSYGITVRNRYSEKLSTGLGYRWTKSDLQQSDGTSFVQDDRVTDLDMLWNPTYNVGLNWRLSYESTGGSNISDTLTSSVSLRCLLDAQTNLNLTYDAQRVRQSDFITGGIFGQRTGGLSGRLTRNFLDGSSLDITYDYRSGNIGQIEWERQLSAIYTVRL